MNIALLASGTSLGKKESLAITVRQYAKELQRRGHKVAIISEKKGGLCEEIDGVPIFRADGGVFFAYPRAFYLARKKLGQFDVIHGFSAAPVFVLRSFLCMLIEPRARVIHTVKSYSRSSFGHYFTWLLNFAHAVTVPTHVYKKKLRLVRKNSISVIRSHIDTSAFYAYSAREKKAIKKKLELPDIPAIFYYGATWNDKGVDDLLHAVRLLIDKKIQIFLLLVTRYELEKPLRELISELKLENNVRIINEQIKVIDYLNAVDICVLPYKSLRGTEGNPSCLLEAVACQTPVVTTKLAELQEIFEDGHDILMASPCDYAELATCIKRLVSEPAFAKQLVLCASKKITLFDIKIVTDQFLKMY